MPNAAPARPYAAKFRLPCAVLGIRTAHGTIAGVTYLPSSERAQAPADALAERAVAELARYLADPEFVFTLPLAHAGTAFRQRVRAELAKIPAGESRTYGEIARALRTAPRAVGGACGANPIALVVPCHRVVGSHGWLGGFMSTKGRPEREYRSAQREGDAVTAVDGEPMAIKRWLLQHEGYRFGA